MNSVCGNFAAEPVERPGQSDLMVNELFEQLIRRQIREPRPAAAAFGFPPASKARREMRGNLLQMPRG
ncbi:MAG TPA: hypothetical protein VL285_05620 [Bryobacteraceae bacterium]|jgi:hypothetical protein|nr:hypothetical protein [Bryobacteraceae bacterium]